MNKQIKIKNLVSGVATDQELADGLALKYDASNPLGFETPTQLTARDVTNRNRANHTGTQLASTISDFAASVRGVILSEILVTTNEIISATDTILSALGKLQGQITNHIGSIGGSHGIATQSVNGFMSSSDKVKIDSMNFYKVLQTSTYTTNSTTPSIVTDMTTVSLPVGDYYFKILGKYRTAATGTGIGFRLVNNSSTMSSIAAIWKVQQGGNGTNAFFEYTQTATNITTNSTGVPTANADFSFKGEGVFTLSASGSVSLNVKSEITNSTVTVQPGTVILIEKIS